MSKTKIFTDLEKQDIIQKYNEQSYSTVELGKQYNCSGPTISKNLKNWGIKLHTKKLDLTGKKFGELTVLSPATKRNDRYTRWKCKCSCGKIIEVRTDYLTSGHTTSCGHLKELYFEQKDLVGQRFGKLIVIANNTSGTKTCRCDCGNIINVKTYNLLNGNTQSCGCLKSKGELKINSILNNLNIDYISQYSFEDCRFPESNRKAYFDYAIFKNHTLYCLIEYDGSQHYKGWDKNKESLQLIQAHDYFKNYYCALNNIPLYRIPYTDYPQLNEKYILSLLQEAYKEEETNEA